MMVSLVLTAIVGVMAAIIVFAVLTGALSDYLENRTFDNYNNAQAAIGRKIDAYFFHDATQYWVKQWQPPTKNAPSWDRYGHWITVDKYYTAMYDPIADHVDCGCFRGTLEDFSLRINRKTRSREAVEYYYTKLHEFTTQKNHITKKVSQS